MWNDIKIIGINIFSPWLVLGDFNNILSPEEKQGGVKVKNYDVQDFVDFVNSLDLIDIKVVGGCFTWYSPKVCSKLGRVMVNQPWINSNFDGFSEFLAPGCISNNSLMIVSCFEIKKSKHKPFKFFNMWTLSEGYLDLIRSRWNYNGDGTKQFILKKLFCGLKKPLQQLNRKHFSPISSRAAAAKSKLLDTQNTMLASGIM